MEWNVKIVNRWGIMSSVAVTTTCDMIFFITLQIKLKLIEQDQSSAHSESDDISIHVDAAFFAIISAVCGLDGTTETKINEIYCKGTSLFFTH